MRNMRWKHLTQMGEAFPVMAKLKNGNYVIFVGAREAEVDGKIEEQIAIFDPLADRHDFIFVTLDTKLFASFLGNSLVEGR